MFHRMPLTQIKKLVREGLATQISESSKLRATLTIEGASARKDGIVTGILLKDKKGNLYAIIGKPRKGVVTYPL